MYDGEMTDMAFEVNWSWMFEPLGGKYTEMRSGESPRVVRV